MLYHFNKDEEILKVHPERASKYTDTNKLPNQPNFEALTYPVNVRDIDIFERNNKGTSVNVYMYSVDAQMIVKRLYKNHKFMNEWMTTNNIEFSTKNRVERDVVVKKNKKKFYLKI